MKVVSIKGIQFQDSGLIVPDLSTAAKMVADEINDMNFSLKDGDSRTIEIMTMEMPAADFYDLPEYDG